MSINAVKAPRHDLRLLLRGAHKPIIGMVHLKPLPGSPFFEGSLEEVRERAMRDAMALVEGGVDAILVQNRGDRTFPKERAGPEVVAAVACIVAGMVGAVPLPVGVHLLRNDVMGSLAVARVCGGAFIRAAALTGVTYSPHGIIEGKPAEVLHYKKRIGADDIAILADIASMHFRALIPQPVEELAQEAAFLGQADGVVVASSRLDEVKGWVRRIKARLPQLPVLIGGYTNPDNIAELLREADGAIVGRAFERSERGGEVDVELVRAFMAATKR